MSFYLFAYRVGYFWTCWRPLCSGLLSVAPHEDEGAPNHPTSWWACSTPHDPQTQNMEWESGSHPRCASRKVAPRMGDTRGCRGTLPRATFQCQKSSSDWHKVPCRAEVQGAPQSALPQPLVVLQTLIRSRGGSITSTEVKTPLLNKPLQLIKACNQFRTGPA